jgi:hypothetical protein
VDESAQLKLREVVPGGEKGAERDGNCADTESDDRLEDNQT